MLHRIHDLTNSGLQILWPDGIFLTKHPKRQRPTPSASSYSSPSGHPPSPLSSPKEDDIRRLDELQENEARRREQFVYELMIGNYIFTSNIVVNV